MVESEKDKNKIEKDGIMIHTVYITLRDTPHKYIYNKIINERKRSGVSSYLVRDTRRCRWKKINGISFKIGPKQIATNLEK